MQNIKIIRKLRYYLYQGLPLLVMFTFIMIYLHFGKSITVMTILEYTSNNYFFAALFLIITYALKSLTIIFPLTLLYLISGIIFMPFVAILINLIGTAITLTIPYWIGWYFGNSLTQKILHKYPKTQYIHQIQKNNNWFFSYLLRVIGILPHDIISLYMGSLRIPYSKYISGSMFGMLPNILIMTLVGINITNPDSPIFISAIIFKLLLISCSIAIYRIILKLRKDNEII